MKVNLEAVLTALDGSPRMLPPKEGVREKEVPMTLRLILVDALVHPKNDDEKTTGEQKLEKWELAKTIKHHPEAWIDLPLSKVEYIKKMVNKIYTTQVVGPVFEMLEKGKSDDQQEKN